MIVECPRCETDVDAKVLGTHDLEDADGPPWRLTLAGCPQCGQPLLASQEMVEGELSRHDLSHASVANRSDAALWRALALAQQGKWAEAREGFRSLATADRLSEVVLGQWGQRGVRGWAEGWLKVEHGEGAEAVERTYLDLLDGRIDPARAHVLSLPR